MLGSIGPKRKLLYGRRVWEESVQCQRMNSQRGGLRLVNKRVCPEPKRSKRSWGLHILYLVWWGQGLSPPLLLGAVSAFKKVELILLVICKSAWVTSRWPAGPFVAFPASCFIECQSNWLENIRIGGKEHPKCKIAIQSWYSLYNQYVWNFTYRLYPVSQWKYNTTMCIKCK